MVFPIPPQVDMWLRDDNGRIHINKSILVFVEAVNQYCDLYFLDGKSIPLMADKERHKEVTFEVKTITIGIGELEDLLMDDNFLRSNRSYLVNLCFVSNYSDAVNGGLILFNGKTFTLAGEGKKIFLGICGILPKEEKECKNNSPNQNGTSPNENEDSPSENNQP